ncbi:MAG TPA: hypothetical protein VKA21_08760, partial [Candidatus Binatia bacterium]|nr:hypothetical protein [Candidatus Binatia bacterium]
DAELVSLRDRLVGALVDEGSDCLRRARDLADFVPAKRDHGRAGRLAEKSAIAFGAADVARTDGVVRRCLAKAARGFRACDRAVAVATRLGAEPTTLGWLKTNLFGPSCATASCHDGATEAGGLVLEGDRPFAELVGVASQNVVAAAAGTLRVRAGDADGSLLYQKLAGTLAPGEGHATAEVGLAPSAATVLRVRRWITDGALPIGPEDITLPVPASGFQLRVPPFDVPPGKEVQRNYYYKAPNPEAVVATRVEFVYPPGSHHLNLFASDTEDRPDGTYEEGFNAVSFETWSMRAASQRERLDWTLPAGVGILVSPRQQFLAQIHFVNVGPQDSPIGGMAAINMHTAPPSSVSQLLGTMFGQNKFIALPPRAESSFDFGTRFDRFNIDFPVKVAAVTGHFHWRGKSFEVRLWDGLAQDASGFPMPGEFERMGPGATIYRSQDWDEPPFQVYRDGEIEVPVGWGVVYRTTFYNATDGWIYFGPQVEIQEHANLFVYFYPGPADGKTLWYPLPFQSG